MNNDSKWIVRLLTLFSLFELDTYGWANPIPSHPMVTANCKNGGFKHHKVSSLMKIQDYHFNLKGCGKAIDVALAKVNLPLCSEMLAPGPAADMHFLSDVIAIVGTPCLFALEPVARMSAYRNIPIIIGLGDQPQSMTPRMLKRYNIMKTTNSTAGILLCRLKKEARLYFYPGLYFFRSRGIQVASCLCKYLFIVGFSLATLALSLF